MELIPSVRTMQRKGRSARSGPLTVKPGRSGAEARKVFDRGIPSFLGTPEKSRYRQAIPQHIGSAAALSYENSKIHII